MMMYNLQRYADAKAVLEPLYRNIEPIDEVHCSCSYLFYFIFQHAFISYTCYKLFRKFFSFVIETPKVDRFHY